MAKPGYFSSTSTSYWDDYLAVRPKYDSCGFYPLIYDYHQTRGSNKWDLAHDVACGPANVAHVLVNRFAHVVASDVSDDHVSAARGRGETEVPPDRRGRVSYVTSSCDAIAGHPRARSEWIGRTDLLAAAECLPLIDVDASLKCWHELLSPGGTLAMWFYGRPIFVEKDAAGRQVQVGGPVQEAYDRMITLLFERFGKVREGLFKHATEKMASWFDTVDLESGDHADKWSGVRRMKINHDRPMTFFRHETFFPELQHKTSNAQTGMVGSDENIVDREFWADEEGWSADSAWKFALANMPNFAADLEKDAESRREIVAAYEELEEAMGGKASRIRVTWPVTLIMATKK